MAKLFFIILLLCCIYKCNSSDYDWYDYHYYDFRSVCEYDYCQYYSSCEENGENGYLCLCQPGYTPIGGECVETSPCLSSHCHHDGATCVDVDAGYDCTCDNTNNGSQGCHESQYRKIDVIVSSADIILTSPEFPSNYSNSMTFVWHLTTYDRWPISFKFTSFDTQAGHDYLQLSGPLVPPLRLEGDLASQVVDTIGGNVTLVFRSDSSVTARGFNVTAFRRSDQLVVLQEEQNVQKKLSRALVGPGFTLFTPAVIGVFLPRTGSS